MTTLNNSNFGLTGLRALVTGGGSGIGRAIADAMINAGATVVVCDVNDSTKPNYICDVSKTNDVEAMFAAIERDLGGLDILVNNVGVPGPTARVDEMDPVRCGRTCCTRGCGQVGQERHPTFATITYGQERDDQR